MILTTNYPIHFGQESKNGVAFRQLQENSFDLLQIKNCHLWHLDSLPYRHKDPFDRLLVCQAQTEDFMLITADRKIWRYDVQTLW